MALSLKHAMTICKIIANITLAVFFCYAIKKHNIKKHRIKTHDDTHGYHNHVPRGGIDTFDATFQSLCLCIIFIVYVYRSLCLVIAIKGKVFYGSVDQHWHCAVCGW